MPTLHKGPSLCYGVKPEWVTMPITNLPAGTLRVRLRLRNRSVAAAFVKTETTIERWYLGPDGDAALKLVLLRGLNRR